MLNASPAWLGSAGLRARARCWIGMAALAFAGFASAAQVDISNPFWGRFGTQVVVLSNGNFVVTAPYPSDVGAVLLFSPDGTLISTLIGSTNGDTVGSGGVTVVGGGSNFVVSSPDWNGVGAATWVDGTTGLGAEYVAVSEDNSLVGTTAGDGVSVGGIVALSNGNYVVLSSSWNNGVAGAKYGAATFGSGSAGVKGVVSSGNSLIGTAINDQVGSAATALKNGNYVVSSPDWNGVGAATWSSGIGGIVGPVSSVNSLVGSTQGDQVGGSGVVALGNGNYVVLSSNWNGGVAASHLGAATWGNGSAGVKDIVSLANSLIGSSAGDQVGSGGVTVVGGGSNFVVSSPQWNGTGAATWVDGTTGLDVEVSDGNSLVGTTAGDGVSGSGIVALSNGNYIVLSSTWNNGVADAKYGAATFGSGSIGVKGSVSSGNSLVGTTSNDQVGSAAAALKNGNYVVSSPNWNSQVGAATWGSGTVGVAGAVSAANSLVGTNAGDGVGARVVALSNGNYAVESPGWNANSGAATWGDGSTGLVGNVSAATSLTGAAGDAVASGVGIALANGKYLATSPIWHQGFGAATLLDGSGSFSGVVSGANSLIGNGPDSVGLSALALSNGNYAVASAATIGHVPIGAVTWGSGTRGTVGTISTENSLFFKSPYVYLDVSLQATGDGNYIVFAPSAGNAQGSVTLANGAFRQTVWDTVTGQSSGGGDYMVFAYNAPYRTLIIGRPRDYVVTLLTMEQIFAGDFE